MEGDNFRGDDIVITKGWDILGPFGIFIQALLGLLSFSALIVKRFFEHPKRPFIVWVLDTSKQAFSSTLAHLLNMFLAMLLSHHNESDNWEWYFINITVDVILGVFLWYYILMLIETIALRYHISALNTGNYVRMDLEDQWMFDFDPTKQTELNDVDLRIWLLQIVIWGLIVTTVKFILFFFQMFSAPVLEFIGDILIGWLLAYPKIKLLVIMMLAPFLLNVFQYWIQDNFLKAKKTRNKLFSKFLPLKRRNSDPTTRTLEMERFIDVRRSQSIRVELRKSIHDV